MEPNQPIQDLQDQVSKLRRDLDELSAQFFKNNFTSSQDFNKESRFNFRLKVPSYTTLPACQVGELIESDGILYICSATDTWTIVGTQVAP